MMNQQIYVNNILQRTDHFGISIKALNLTHYSNNRIWREVADFYSNSQFLANFSISITGNTRYLANGVAGRAVTFVESCACATVTYCWCI